MGSSKKSGGCLRNIILTAIIVGGIAYIKDGGLDDLLSSFSDDDGYSNYESYETNDDGSAEVTEAHELQNVPSELRDNVYLDYIDGGYCEKFLGNIEINVIFITDNDSKWDQTSKSKAEADIQEQQTRIIDAAASSGVTVDISVRYHEAELIGQSVVNNDVDGNWKNAVLNSTGLGDFPTAQPNIESLRGVSSAPLVFLFNTGGRATASHQPTGLKSIEFITLYSNGISSLFHEMCHLYGAKDFYYPNEVKALADKYLPDSIMNSGDKVDPLTAFLIGWTDTLSSSAESFLRETSYITNEYLHAKHEVETLTGYVENYEYSDGSYTGYLKDGWAHGEGTLKMKDGTYQSGTWDNGRFLNGECIIYYKDGTVFKGNKVNGEISGYGEMKYSNGSIYKGDFYDGLRHGQGTMNYADGDTYTGGWENGNRSGYGTYIYNNGTKEEGYYTENKGNGQSVIYYADGGVFRGNKVDGVISGYGEMTYKEGGWYKGNYSDGKRNGYGEMKYTDGAVYKGNWVDGNRHGEGTLYYANGAVYSGNWSGNTVSGQGTMNYKNGDSYTGGWKDGKRHGYGTYTWANGSVKSGNWSNGDYVG